MSAEACKYEFSHGKSMSSQQQREKQSQAGKQPVNSVGAGPHHLNIDKFLAIIFTSGGNTHSILVSQNPFVHHWSTDVRLVCHLCVSYVRVFKFCSQELFSLVLNKNQKKTPFQWLCKIIFFSLTIRFNHKVSIGTT